MNKKIISIITFFFAILLASGQSVSYTDPAQAFNKLMLDKLSGTYTLIGSYKVTGTPYLFGDRNKATVYAKEGEAKDVFVSYNTYNQSIEVFKSKSDVQGLVKDMPSVDSFILVPQNQAPLRFINGSFLGVTDKNFYQLAADGNKVKLYKRYVSQLGYVSTNYIQSELRQFDLNYDYFYYDMAKKFLKKLKTDSYSVKKELGRYTSLSTYLEDEAMSTNPEATLKTIFAAINSL